MCDLYKIITRPRKVDHKLERRLWVELGVPLSLSHQFSITTYLDRPETIARADQLEVRFRLLAPGMEIDVFVDSKSSLDMADWIGLVVTPICIWRRNQEVYRVQLQIVDINKALSWGNSGL